MGLPNSGLFSAITAFEQGSLSCHTCYDTKPRFKRSYPKDCPAQSFLTTSQVTGDLIQSRFPKIMIHVPIEAKGGLGGEVYPMVYN